MDIRVEYAALKPKTMATVAELLARHGAAFDKWLHNMVRATREANPDRADFPIWVVEALAWATFALRDDNFFRDGSLFVETGDARALSSADQYPGVYGTNGRLREALLSFRRLYEGRASQMAKIGDDVKKWHGEQSGALALAQQMKNNGQLGSVGVWLFCAPFKILAIANASSWSGRDLDRVPMPTGSQVEHALDMLRKDGVSSAQQLPSSSGGGLTADFADVFAAHLFQVELAKCADTSVLHINSALYQLGYRGH